MPVLMLLIMACDPDLASGRLKTDTNSAPVEERVAVAILGLADGDAIPMGQDSRLVGEVVGASEADGLLCYWSALPELEEEVALLDAEGRCVLEWGPSEAVEYPLLLETGTAAGVRSDWPSDTVVLRGDPPPEVELSLVNSVMDWRAVEGGTVEVSLTVKDNGGTDALTLSLSDDRLEGEVLLRREEDDGVTSTWTASLVELEAGEHHLEALAVDEVGGRGLSAGVLTVISASENSAPTLTLDSVSLEPSDLLDGAYYLVEEGPASFTFSVEDADALSDSNWVEVEFYWELVSVSWSDLLDVCDLSPETPSESWETDGSTFYTLVHYCSQRLDLEAPTSTCVFEAPAIDDTSELTCIEGEGDVLMVEEAWRHYRIWATATDSLGGVSEPMEFNLTVYDTESRDGDLDGASLDDGDCDDEDPERHPGAVDMCEASPSMAGQVDDDCDDLINEDSADSWDLLDEGNNSDSAVLLGDVFEHRDSDPVVSVAGNLHWGETSTGDGDEDWYRVEFEEDVSTDDDWMGGLSAGLKIVVLSTEQDIVDYVYVEVYRSNSSGATLEIADADRTSGGYSVVSGEYYSSREFLADSEEDDLFWYIRLKPHVSWNSNFCEHSYELTIECTTC